MTPEELQAIKNRVDNTTLGEWVATIVGEKLDTNTVYTADDEYMVAGRLSRENAVFIANAPTDIRNLLAKIERLTSQSRMRDDMAKARVVQFQQSRDNEQMLAKALMKVAPDVLKALPLHGSVNELDKVMIEFGEEQRAKDAQIERLRNERTTAQTTIAQLGDQIAALEDELAHCTGRGNAIIVIDSVSLRPVLSQGTLGGNLLTHGDLSSWVKAVGIQPAAGEGSDG
jgi:hypothetical protein